MNKFSYLLTFQYLGFRYHGWQKQKDVKTVQFMLERTLQFILGHDNFKTLGASRTDSMVSALKSACMITLREDRCPQELLRLLNENLPADIRALELERCQSNFSIISSPKSKTYYYLFSNEEKAWPFAAPFMCNIVEPLDIELMQKGVELFQGERDFKAYCYKPSEATQTLRRIDEAALEENRLLQANFFPPNSYVCRFKGKGFMRHQIRLMMGALFRLGRGEIKLEDIENSFSPDATPVGFVAPASGLFLGDLNFLN